MLSKEEIIQAKERISKSLNNVLFSTLYSQEENEEDERILLAYIKELETKLESMYWEGYIQKQNEAMQICKQCKYIKKSRELETKNQKLIEINDKYLQKLVYALTPTTHTLGDDYNNAFKKIITENIDLETCKIKRKLKECWGIDKIF